MKFERKLGKDKISVQESDPPLGVIIDRYGPKGKLKNSVTVWYDDLEED